MTARYPVLDNGLFDFMDKATNLQHHRHYWPATSSDNKPGCLLLLPGCDWSQATCSESFEALEILKMRQRKFANRG